MKNEEIKDTSRCITAYFLFHDLLGSELGYIICCFRLVSSSRILLTKFLHDCLYIVLTRQNLKKPRKINAY